MNYVTIKPYDIANGLWVRVSLFVSGCHHKCPGCFNAEAWDFSFWKPFTNEIVDYIIDCLKPDYISWLSLLWWEPLAIENQPSIYNLIVTIKKIYPNKTIRCYSWFTYEEIVNNMFSYLPYTRLIFDYIDVLVDGKWIQSLANLNLKFRWSANQRVIDIQKTIDQNSLVWFLDEIEKNKYIPM